MIIVNKLEIIFPFNQKAINKGIRRNFIVSYFFIGNA